MKNVVILLRTCPYGMATAGEGFRAASGLAGIGQNVSVVFMEDGVLAGVKNQNPDIISMQNVSQAYKELPEFGGQNYFLRDSLEERNIKPDDLEFGEIIDNDKLKEMLDTSDVVMSFS